MRVIFSLFCFVLFVVSAVAQPLNKPTYSTMVETAEEQVDLNDYYNAITYYEESYEEVKDYDVAIKLGMLNYYIRDYKDAERWFSRALRRDKEDQYAEHLLMYGRCLKLNEKCDQAIKEFEKFIAFTKDEALKELAQNEINGCEFAKVAPDPEGLTISNAGRNVNTNNSEYSAVLDPNGTTMYYSSFMTDDVIIVDGKAENTTAKILMSSKTEDGWGEPSELSQDINRPGCFTANATLSKDGNRMYFTRQLLSGNVVTESKIYVSQRSGSSWGPANEVIGVNGDYIATHPAVGELYGSEVLFFTSDMDGGNGGYDLYYATYKGGEVYGDPVNLGPKLNTAGDEITPFYRDGTLYFSSNGHPGLGGMDIFSTIWDGSRWSSPTNMGKGYNTHVDDKYFMLDEEGYSGFLLSNRPGTRSNKGKTCCDDIYNVSLKIILADVIAATFDQETKEALAGATVELIDLTEEDPLKSGSQTNTEGNNFNFALELDKAYMLIATAENYFADTVEFNTVGLLDSKTFELPLELVPAPVYITITKENPITLSNIYYDFDDDKILPDAEDDLKLVFELLNEYPDMVIELSSHTDARGDDNYNRNLSQRRAESARRWLIDKDVVRRRVQAVGYGETVPVTVTAAIAAEFEFLNEGDVLTEDFINGLEGEEVQEQAHRINRRTEFKIIEGPTSIKIEETRLIRKGNKKIEGAVPVEEGEEQKN